jgi:hypothetical protein
MAVDGAGAVTVVGTPSSTFPVTPGAYDVNNTNSGIFVARLSAGGNALLYGSYFGSSSLVSSVAVDASGAATFAGTSDPTPGLPTTPGAFDTSYNGSTDAFVARLQISTFAHPLMAFPDCQLVPVGGILGFQIVGPTGAPLALMLSPVAQNIPLPPFGTLGVSLPPLVTVDGIGLGFPGSIPVPLAIGSQGILYFSYAPVPPFLVGVTLYAQVVGVAASLPGIAALSTHGNVMLPTPACAVTFTP